MILAIQFPVLKNPAFSHCAGFSFSTSSKFSDKIFGFFKISVLPVFSLIRRLNTFYILYPYPLRDRPTLKNNGFSYI